MSAYLIASLILWGMVLCLVLLVWAWLTVEVIEWARDFHRERLKRVRTDKQRMDNKLIWDERTMPCKYCFPEYYNPIYKTK